ncbi:MAG TPA: hypothetical protein VFY13_10165 [Luteolibacter sp.]|nr:hypothetical protein [Luteolibacter sp.]
MILPSTCLRLALVTCMMAAACAPTATTPPTEVKKEEAPPQATHEWIGSISSVDRQQGFVLIRSQLSLTLPAGTVLTSSSPEGAEPRRANLLLTGEALGNFAAADIQSGAVEIGDGVYRLKLREAPVNGPENNSQTTEVQSVE